MTTGDLRTNFADKRKLPQQRIKDTFFDYLVEQLTEIASRVWAGRRGIFGTASLTSAADEVSVTGLPVDMLDGDGNILTLSGTNGTSLKLENALGVDYEIAGRHVLIPSGMVQNPRNQVVNYDTWEDEIGESADPDSVVEAAGQLTIVVDSVYESGVSHAGRLLTVYLKKALTTVESVAIERDLVVSWDGSNNKVVTAGLLGQPSGSASTSVADYTVVAQGLTIRRNTVLSTLSPYAFVGTATGAGAGNPPATSTGGQVDVSNGINPSLDETYDNSGANKRISLDDGAMELETLAGVTGDLQNAQLRLKRFGSTEWMQFQLVLQIGDTSAVPLAILQAARQGVVLAESEAVDQAAPDLLNFTRGGVDLQDAGLRLTPDLHLVLMEAGPEAGTLYAVKSINSGTQLAVMSLQSSGSPSPWTVGSGRSARVLVPRVIFANNNVHPDATVLDLWKGLLFVLRDGQGTATPMRIAPDGASGEVIQVLDNDAAPGNALVYDTSNLGSDDAPWRFGRPVFMSNPSSFPTDGQDGFRVKNGGGGEDTLQPRLAFAAGDEVDRTLKGGISGDGAMVRGHWFRDDFFYHPTRLDGTLLTLPHHYDGQIDAGGLIDAFGGGIYANNLAIRTGAVPGRITRLEGPPHLEKNSDRGFQWRFRARFVPVDDTAVIYQVGFLDVTGGRHDAWFEWEVGVNGDRWQFVYWATAGRQFVDTGLSADTNFHSVAMSQLGDRTWLWWIANSNGVAQNTVDLGGGNEWDDSNGETSQWQPQAQVETSAAFIKELRLDYWEWWDGGHPLWYRLGSNTTPGPYPTL